MNLMEESAELEVSVHFTSAKSGLNGAPLRPRLKKIVY